MAYGTNYVTNKVPGRQFKISMDQELSLYQTHVAQADRSTLDVPNALFADLLLTKRDYSKVS